MAGGGSLGGGEKAKRGKQTRKKSKRMGFHLDMTPLVDITFLLLTFFMFTTTMATPQIMEMKLPPEVEADIQVKESELLNFFVESYEVVKKVNNEEKVIKESRILWYYYGNPLEEITVDKVKDIAVKHNLLPEIDDNNMITALKVDDNADYGLVVQILDELNLAEIDVITDLSKRDVPRERKFTIAKLGEADYTKIKDELPAPGKVYGGGEE